MSCQRRSALVVLPCVSRTVTTSSCSRWGAGIAGLQEFTLVRSAWRVQLVIADIETIQSGGHVADDLVSFGIDAYADVISRNGTSMLDGKFHGITWL